MKNILFLIFFSFITVFSFSQVSVKANTKASSLKWTGSKVTSSHEGTIKLKSGELTINKGKLVGGEFIIDMTSIETTDMEAVDNAKLDKHLKANDFFGVEKHPTSLIKITEVTYVSESKYKVIADLTIKNITHSVSFDAEVKINNNSYLAIATIVFDRTKYDIKYNSGSYFDDLGNYLILDDVQLNVFLLSEK
ncbi:MAG: YceI family protein [Flavobacteriales bacterium]|nr:YceI family protein [Flavobacteriales bacterium]